ncbi:hypothetical protein Q7C36_012035 [Tachysurus vachellii]|uniref:Saposin B-type domain-containing protein n=1 Tax=Tachysurus vachellii TaxID=175792 RepID=A0AA88MVA4_TACVA|nr:hypothetical protein Q7C36_012035 [Tachysurus vachellii]
MTNMSFILLSVLLMVSAAFAEHDGFSISSHEGNLNIATFSAPPKWQKNQILCCTCQDFVKQTTPKVHLKLQQNINKFCNMFTPHVKNKCLGFGGKLKEKILKFLFPGKNIRDTCQKRKLCMY